MHRLDQYRVTPGNAVKLKEFDCRDSGGISGKQEARTLLAEGIERLAELQDVLYADNRFALLLIFQAMDAAGKDSAIKHVMSGVNPQGCQVFSFKAPSAQELDHDYLWRCLKTLPERGRIGIFNRSYYEEVLVVRVHPEILDRQKLPPDARGAKVWKHRFEDITNVERYLTRNGIVIRKFFLHVSKEEQKKRFLERIDREDKNWKFSIQDVEERQHWDAYQEAYEEMLTHTSTDWAPWYVVPADRKWFTRLVIGGVIIETLESLGLRYPSLDEEGKAMLQKARTKLEQED
jgi:PPK2 family polyphosphate:nucleotide phosphotransferase